MRHDRESQLARAYGFLSKQDADDLARTYALLDARAAAAEPSHLQVLEAELKAARRDGFSMRRSLADPKPTRRARRQEFTQAQLEIAARAMDVVEQRKRKSA